MSTLPPDHAKPAAPAPGTDHDALPPGTRFGEFEIVRVLGVGGFGIVYLAKDHSLERDVALKEYMPASLAARGHGPQITIRSSSFAETYAIGLRSFVNEARLLARFDHPSLVKVYRFWEDNSTAYMVMPFLQGITLRDTRRAMPHPPDEAWIRSVIAPILSALELLHREGVYHRDIAPDNILLPPDGPPVLLDFGAARRVISDRTQSLTAILKPSYAPIEQYAEMAQMRQGPWTDLYALGAVIHYLLFGAPPAPATARAVQDDADSIESRIVPGVSPRFLEAVSWMLSLRPNQRPQNGEQLRAVLDGHAPVPARGRPGITLPGALAPAAAVAAYEPTRLVDPAARSGVNTAYVPTHLPTAAAPAPVRTAPPPTTRAPVRPPTTTVPPLRTGAPVTSGPSRGGPGPRPATLPPPVPPSQTRPPVLSPPTRPAPLAARPQPLAAASATPAASGPSSKPWVAVVAGGIGLVVLALAGWQFVASRNAAAVPAGASAASSAPTVAGSTTPAATPPPLAATVGTPQPVVLTTPEAAVRPASAALPDDASKRLAAVPARAASSPALDASGKPLLTDRPALAGAAAPGASSASAVRRAQGRPVPGLDGSTTATGVAPARPIDGSPYGTSPGPGGYGGDSQRPYGQAGRDRAIERPVPAALAAEPATAREACGNRAFIAMAICMDEKCEEPRYRQTQECASILVRKHAREGR
jgi:hypothetical protein